MTVSLALSFFGYHMANQTECNKNGKLPASNPTLYSWGSGRYGQLGLGSDSNKPTPEKVEELQNIHIVGIDAKSDSSAALSSTGQIYTWGRAKGGVLGHLNLSSVNLSLPKLIESLSDIKFSQMSCGQHHMAAISNEGFLYTWGNNEHGRLGHDPEPNLDTNKKLVNTQSIFLSGASMPKRVLGELSDKKCVQVSCGQLHTLCLTSDGSVYTWGSYKKGVLGYNSNQDVKQPKKVDFFNDKKVLKIAAGPDFNYALTEDGKLYSWGNNDYGQLGNPSKSSYEPPSEVRGFGDHKIADVSAGDTFVAALSNDGKLYSWGYGNEGQLGHGNKDDLKAPKLLEFDEKISSVSCGNGHTGFITKSGAIYMFGRGREGQLGRANTIESTVTHRTSPQKITAFDNKRAVSVACGGDHTLALVE